MSTETEQAPIQGQDEVLTGGSRAMARLYANLFGRGLSRVRSLWARSAASMCILDDPFDHMKHRFHSSIGSSGIEGAAC